MTSAQAIHQAARAELERRFFTSWCERAPFAQLHPRFRQAIKKLKRWPSPEEYGDLAALVPQSEAAPVELPRFVAQEREAVRRWGGYERHVAQTRAVPTRERCWHDFFNMAVWAHFPRLRWALNELHVDTALGPVDPRNGRAPAQNVAAQLDESGIVVVSSSPELLNELRSLRFKRVFWEKRGELLATTCFWIVGHGALESLLTPHLGLAGKAVLVEVAREPGRYDADALRHHVDRHVAAQIHDWRHSLPMLHPVPLLGIPGYADNGFAQFYDDARYFRFQRRTRTT